MEILAPAGGKEQLTAAVRSGADAVYLGAGNFNARRNAENFDRDGLRQALIYCHARGVKVYVALNTVITDAELEAARAEVENAALLGADGVIVQDLAMARLVKSISPDMPLHASTQMTVHNASGAAALERLGFTRVVPARELSISELKKIRESTSLELEVFVHGALCMCVSGQCYLSSVLGQRSANRGLCAQPCRLDFRSKNGGSALSLKDLSAVEMLPELEKSGVTSAKIEGRMKRPEYVAEATRACVRTLAGQSYDKARLQAVFSRGGFTNGYLMAKRDRDMFGHRTKQDVTSAVPVLKAIAADYRAELQRVPVSMTLTVKAGAPALLSVFDGKNKVTVSGEIPQDAQKRALSEKDAENAIKKCGGTPFYAKKTDISIEDGLFLSVSALNSLRKEGLSRMLDVRGKITPRKTMEYSPALYDIGGGKLRIYARFESKESMCDGADKIIFDYEKLYNDISLCNEFKEKLIAELPALMFSEVGARERLMELKRRGINAVYAPNLYATELARGLGFKLIGGFRLNINNSLALAEYAKTGLSEAEISFECSLSRFERLKKPIPCGIAAYGKMPLMTFRNCPIKGERGCDRCIGRGKITDRFNNEFTVVCHSKRYSTLLNPKPIYMCDKRELLKSADFLTLHFTDESKSECERIIECARRGTAPEGEFTRALYFKTLK